MIDLSQTGLRGRTAICTSAPFVSAGDRHAFYEGPNEPSVGDHVLIVSDAPRDNGDVDALFWDSDVFTVDAACLTIVPRHVPELVVPIPPEVCANVVYAFDGRGYPSGEFFRKLLHAVVGADPHNRRRLALGFPEWVRAVNLAQNEPGGLNMMMKANRENRPLL